MVVYMSAMALSMFFAYCVTYKIKGFSENGKVIISAIPLFLVSALRYDVGSDYFSYIRYFLLGDRYIGEKMETGFRLLRNIIYHFTQNSYIYVAIVVGIFVFVVMKSIWNLSESPIFSIFLLVTTTLYFISMNTARQAIAIVIALYALRFLKDDQIVKYCVCIILASTVHISILVCLVIVVIYKMKITPKIAVMLLGGMYIAKTILLNLLLFILKGTKYYYYFYTTYYENRKMAVTYVLVCMGITLLAAWYYRRGSKSDKMYQTYFNVMIIATALGILSGSIPLGKRLMWNFMFVQIMFVPLILKQEKIQKVRIILTFVLGIAYIMTMYSNIVINGDHSVLPYQSILTLGY